MELFMLFQLLTTRPVYFTHRLFVSRRSRRPPRGIFLTLLATIYRWHQRSAQRLNRQHLRRTKLTKDR